MFDPLAETPTSAIWLAFSVALKLGLVLLLFYAILSVIRRLKLGTLGQTNKRLSLLETLYLSPKQKLHLIRIGDRTLLVAATEEKISMLSEVEVNLAEETELRRKQLVHPLNSYGLAYNGWEKLFSSIRLAWNPFKKQTVKGTEGIETINV